MGEREVERAVIIITRRREEEDEDEEGSLGRGERGSEAASTHARYVQ